MSKVINKKGMLTPTVTQILAKFDLLLTINEYIKKHDWRWIPHLAVYTDGSGDIHIANSKTITTDEINSFSRFCSENGAHLHVRPVLDLAGQPAFEIRASKKDS